MIQHRMRPVEFDHNKRLIVLSVIQLSGGHYMSTHVCQTYVEFKTSTIIVRFICTIWLTHIMWCDTVI